MFSGLTDLISSLDENQVNVVPYKDGWTAGQLIRHVTKSVDGMKRQLDTPAKRAERDAGERIPQLKEIFLDFNKKMKSPEFIIPEEGHYEKKAVLKEIGNSFQNFIESAGKANLSELVEGLPLGPITKLEMVHFVLFHTKRHLHQLEKICGAILGKNTSN